MAESPFHAHRLGRLVEYLNTPFVLARGSPQHASVSDGFFRTYSKASGTTETVRTKHLSVYHVLC